MGGNEREIELITADFKAGLAAVYSDYPALVQNVTVRKQPDSVVAEQVRQQQIAAMKRKGYKVVEHPFWFVSHRAIPDVDDYLSFTTQAGFDGVVLIAENDWVVHRRGYGQARVRGELANSPLIAFPIGNITKGFTAQATLLLEEARELKLSGNLGRIFRASPSDKKTIAIKHLLTHTSGLERDVILEGEETGKEVLDVILDSKLQALPVEGYHYSNAGYQLLALIIQKITRQPYDQFLKEQILSPFQLKQTGFYHQPPKHTVIADGYITSKAQPFRPRSVMSYTYLGSEGLIMTADDLFRWFRSLSKLPFFFEMSRPRLDIETSHGFASKNKLVPSALSF